MTNEPEQANEEEPAFADVSPALGSNLPHASVNDLRSSPDGSYLLAATHGRGIWTIPTP